MILAAFRGECSTAERCRRAQIPESTVRDWRDRFLAAGTAALEPGKPPQGDAEQAAWLQENARWKTVVADLSVETLVLKTGRNGGASLVSI